MIRALTLERRQRQRKHRRQALFLLFVLVGGVGMGYYALFLSSWFSIRRVEIVGTHALTPADIEPFVPAMEGISLFTVDPVWAQQVERHPRLRSAAFKKKLPHTLQIKVVERSPIAIVVLDSLYGIDKDRVIFPLVHSSDFDHPLITGLRDVPYQVGMPLELPQLEPVVEFLAISETYAAVISEIQLESETDVTVYTLSQGIKARIEADQFPQKMYYLTEMIDDINQRGLPVAEIDLRYDDAAVVKLQGH